MTRQILIRPAALLVAAAMFVAACGTGTSATTAPTTIGSATQAPATVVPATQAPASPGFSIDLPNEDPELEALLPDEIGGAPLMKVSMSGASFLGAGQAGSEDVQQMLTALGKTPEDLSVAFASNQSVVLLAFRIKGADASQIYDAVVASQQAEDVADITDVTVGGKPAKKLVDSNGTTSYLYLTGDTLVSVTGVGELSEATLNEIFSKLP